MIHVGAVQVVTVFSKELTELFRDWRTILLFVGVPLVLFPLLVSLALAGGDGRGGQTEVAVVGEDSLSAVRFLQSLDRFTSVPVSDGIAAETGVSNGDFPVALHFRAAGTRVELIYNNSEPNSAEIAAAIGGALERYSTSLAAQRLEDQGIAADVLTPLRVEHSPLHHGARAAGTLVLSLLVPVLALLSAAIGPLAAAGDLGAGEKERGTLEPLFGTCAARSAVVVGKFLAVMIMTLLGVASFFLGAVLAYLAGPALHDTIELEFVLQPRSVVLTVVFVVLTAAVFSALELTVSLCARSAKAAQTLFLPVLILASAAGYGTVTLSDVHGWYAHVPLLNLGLALKASIIGETFHALTVVLWALFYVAVAMGAATVVVRSEAVIGRG